MKKRPKPKRPRKLKRPRPPARLLRLADLSDDELRAAGVRTQHEYQQLPQFIVSHN